MAVEMKWYVYRAVSGKEAKVKEYIEGGIQNGLYDGNVAQVLIPTEKVYTQRGSKRVIKERNFLPGYVLVEARMIGETAHLLRSTPNVLGTIGEAQPHEINRLLGKVDEMQEEILDMTIPYNVGDKVKVTDGPFGGFSGVVEDVDNAKKKLKVMVKVFGRNTPSSLGFMQVEREG